MEHDLMIKLLLVGDPGGGKTSLCARFSNNGFSSKYIATLGVEFMVKTVQAGSRRLKLQIWDTSGQEKFLAITEKHYRLTKAFVIVYDMTDRSSFTHVQKWLASIDRSCPASSLRHLVAAKCDIPDPAVTEEEGRALAQSLGLGFTSCSAKEDKNVEELFLEVAAAACDLVAAEQYELQCLQTPMVITVLASLGEAVHDGIELVGLDLAGAELGKCCLDDINAMCADGLSALLAALNIRQGQVVRFVTQGGVILPTDNECEYEEDPAEVIFKLETKEDIHSFEVATQSALKSHGLHRIDNVDQSLTVVDKDGAPVHPDIHLSDVDAERYPLTFKFSVKRRTDPKTVINLFDLDTQAKS